MHCLGFVIVENGKNNARLRVRAINTLADAGFIGEKGEADWGVIGGRWSGVLIGSLPEHIRVIKSLNDTEIDQYNLYGDEDDAMEITPQLVKWIKNKWGDVEVFMKGKNKKELLHKEVKDFDWEKVIGKVIVVLDYHF